jgi:hypothetical protein
MAAQNAAQDPDFDPFCLPGGPAGVAIPGIDFEEAFWWTADADMSGPGLPNALLVLAIEAAFSTGDPAVGAQVVFARIRVRANVNATGSYTVTTPYNTKVFNVPQILPGAFEINDTIDVGVADGDFVRVLAGPVGPFLKCVTPAPPAGYLGNVNVACTVTGSPTGNNFFRITGPGTNVQQNRFFVSGKLFTGVLPTPIVVERTTYSRTATTGQVEVVARSLPTAAVRAIGVTPAPVVLSKDTTGGFFSNIQVGPAATLPAVMSVSASSPGKAAVTVQSNLVDVVTVTGATFDGKTGRIAINATSSDQSATPPTLTATGFGPLVGGVLTTTPLTATPPADVQVTSSKGGSGTRMLTYLPGSQIAGFVRTSAGAGVQGVRINLTGAATSFTTTNANGAYFFRDLRNGAYTVRPAPQTGFTFIPASRAVTIAGANVAGVNFTRTAVVAGVSINGLVRNAAGVRQAGVTMTLRQGTTVVATVTTNATGVYSFPGVAAGTYTVTPTLTGATFTPASRTDTVAAASVNGVNFTRN